MGDPLTTENAVRRLLGAAPVRDPFLDITPDGYLTFPDDAERDRRIAAHHKPPRRAAVARAAGEVHRRILRAPGRGRYLLGAPERALGRWLIRRVAVVEFHSPHVNMPGTDSTVEGYLRAPYMREGLYIDIIALQDDLPSWYRFAATDSWCFDRDAVGVPAPALTPELVHEAVRRALARRLGTTPDDPALPLVLMTGVEWEWPEDAGSRILRDERVRDIDRAAFATG